MSNMKETKVGSGKKSSIEQNSLINEIIKRDNRFQSINKVFTLNLKRLKIITDKPNNLKNEQLDPETRRSGIPISISNKIKDYFKIPSEKYNYPLTSSHEFGWDKEVYLNKEKKHPRFTCDVTSYANEYQKLTGRSPYASKDPIKKNEK